MTAIYHLRVQSQYRERENRYPYGYYWRKSSNEPTDITVHADSFEEADAKAQALLARLPGTDWRYKVDIISVDTQIEPEPESEPTPTILHRGPKGFRYKGV